MSHKGLCSTCDFDSYCTFPRGKEVLHCEEFTTNTYEVKKSHLHILKSGKNLIEELPPVVTHE